MVKCCLEDDGIEEEEIAKEKILLLLPSAQVTETNVDLVTEKIQDDVFFFLQDSTYVCTTLTNMLWCIHKLYL